MDSDRRTPNGNQKKRPGKTNEKNFNPRQVNGLKGAKGKGTVSKASVARADSCPLVSDTNSGSENPEVYEDLVIHYVDDVNKSAETRGNGVASVIVSKLSNDDNSLDEDKVSNQDKGEISESDSAKESLSSEKTSESNPSKESSKSGTQREDGEANNRNSDVVTHTDEKSHESCGESASISSGNTTEKNLDNMRDPAKPSSESFEENEHKPAQDRKEIDVLYDATNGTQSTGSEDERFDAGKNGIHENAAELEVKIEEMETRIEKLEEELREVAALEISLYSVVPEHGSSAHKVHTPARRLSRLYIHACKHWTQDRKGTIAKNTVSGLILIARSCSNDIPRLTFWLSNTIVLREIISQAFGGSRSSSPFTRFSVSKGTTKSAEGKFSTLNRKGATNNKKANGFMQAMKDWQDTGTFIGALEKIESWIFSRLVESVWWQALTAYMQTPDGNSSNSKITGTLLGPALGDQQQGSFSIDLWRNAFQDAFQQLCPVRAGGHECGCLPILARMVMKQCLARLDVAMFNAILRESAHEIPTDPVSDPIVDSKVLPIPAGDLSFGSGAQLKNSVGNWSRWISDAIGMDIDDDAFNEDNQNGDESRSVEDSEPKSFILLNELSDLLMLPKDMLIDRTIRKEVCPSISLALVKRILCNFTPDEFCPDAVPGAVLEALNAESIVERRLSGDTTRNFPYTAATVVYSPPSSADVAEKVAEAGERSPLARSVSIVQRKGYTSDEELDDLNSPLATIVDQLQSPSIHMSNENGKHVGHLSRAATNVRYDLLREVWSV